MFNKYKLPFFIILLVLVIDQTVKLYIKSHYSTGEVTRVVDDWFRITFTENPGMAFGLEFGGVYGKLALSLFRIIAVCFGFYYIKKIVEERQHKGFIICVSLVLAGALGNILDSAFYGLIFDKGSSFNQNTGGWEGYCEIANFTTNGYGHFLQGHVVDMLYFPIYEGEFPTWLPIWGGEHFEFFNAIFNVADMAISFGVCILLVFQKWIYTPKQTSPI